MTYTIREVTDARSMDLNGFASFDTREEAIAHINDSFDVLGVDEFEGEYVAMARTKGFSGLARIFEVVAR